MDDENGHPHQLMGKLLLSKINIFIKILILATGCSLAVKLTHCAMQWCVLSPTILLLLGYYNVALHHIQRFASILNVYM